MQTTSSESLHANEWHCHLLITNLLPNNSPVMQVCITRHYLLCYRKTKQLHSSNESNDGTATDLSDSMIGAFNKDLLRPPIIFSHCVHEPLTTSAVGVEQLGSYLYPLQHRRLKAQTETSKTTPQNCKLLVGICTNHFFLLCHGDNRQSIVFGCMCFLHVCNSNNACKICSHVCLLWINSYRRHLKSLLVRSLQITRSVDGVKKITNSASNKPMAQGSCQDDEMW